MAQGSNWYVFSHLNHDNSSLVHMIMETCDNTQVSQHDVTSQVFMWRTHSKLMVLIFEVGSLTWDLRHSLNLLPKKWLLSKVVVKLYRPLLCNYQIKSQWSWYKQARGKRHIRSILISWLNVESILKYATKDHGAISNWNIIFPSTLSIHWKPLGSDRELKLRPIEKWLVVNDGMDIFW